MKDKTQLNIIKSVVITLLILSTILLSGCVKAAKMSIDTKKVVLSDGVDSEFIKIEVVRTDNLEESQVFTINIEQFEHIKIIDTQGKEKYSFQTKPLETKGVEDTIQFRVKASKDGFDYARKTLTINLISNGTSIQSENLKVEIN